MMMFTWLFPPPLCLFFLGFAVPLASFSWLSFFLASWSVLTSLKASFSLYQFFFSIIFFLASSSWLSLFSCGFIFFLWLHFLPWLHFPPSPTFPSIGFISLIWLHFLPLVSFSPLASFLGFIFSLGFISFLVFIFPLHFFPCFCFLSVIIFTRLHFPSQASPPVVASRGTFRHQYVKFFLFSFLSFSPLVSDVMG